MLFNADIGFLTSPPSVKSRASWRWIRLVSPAGVTSLGAYFNNETFARPAQINQRWPRTDQTDSHPSNVFEFELWNKLNRRPRVSWRGVIVVSKVYVPAQSTSCSWDANKPHLEVAGVDRVCC